MMIRRILIVALWGFASIGAISVTGVAALWYVTLGPGNSPEKDNAEPNDVAFVLNWAGLAPGRIESVVNSYESSRSLMGDHLDAYEIKVTHLSSLDLSEDDDGERRWYRGDRLPSVVGDAVEFTAPLREASWFPSTVELKREDTWVLPWQITLYGMRIQQAQLIIAQPSKKRVLFVSHKI